MCLRDWYFEHFFVNIPKSVIFKCVSVIDILSIFFVNVPLSECHRTPLMISQEWFWFGAWQVATSHHLHHEYWPIHVMPYCLTRPQLLQWIVLARTCRQIETNQWQSISIGISHKLPAPWSSRITEFCSLCHQVISIHGTVKPVYNDHLMGYLSAFWSSSRWPTYLPSGAHLGGPWPPRWAPEGRNC